MYTKEQVVKALEVYVSVYQLTFDIDKFMQILAKAVERNQTTISNDPMEANICDSCQ